SVAGIETRSSMPLYEYECEACAHRFEVIQRFDDPPPTSCPVCSGKLRKLLSPPAIHFKGTGWYVTDYSKKGAAPADREPAKETGEGSQTKTAEAAGSKTSQTSSAPESADKPSNVSKKSSS
ncbi:MAG: FmdB family zinc ribbon protein, partial [Acidimicrobiia bacterium]